MIYQSVIDSFVSTYSPLKAPQLWTRINAVLVIWSVLLLIEILFTLGPLERLEGTRAYLTYNFGATLVWVAQVGLTILDMQDTLEGREDEEEYRSKGFFTLIIF